MSTRFAFSSAIGLAVVAACSSSSGSGNGPDSGIPSDAAGVDVAQGGGSSSGGGSTTGSSSSGGGTSGGGTSGDASGGDDGGSLNPTLPPGSNFDLALWELQEPVGSPGNPTTISNKQLEGGYQDAYFSTDKTDGAMTFWDPEDGVTTPGSNYPRSELRELNPDGSDANWGPTGTSTLSATVEVVSVPDHVCVGQIHIGSPLPDSGVAASSKPLLELFYYSSGEIRVGIEATPAGGNETQTMLATVPLGTKFSYVISLTGTSAGATIGITINGSTMMFPMPASFEGYGEYFKAGDYDQSVGDAGIGATVKFYALSVSHSA